MWKVAFAAQKIQYLQNDVLLCPSPATQCKPSNLEQIQVEITSSFLSYNMNYFQAFEFVRPYNATKFVVVPFGTKATILSILNAGTDNDNTSILLSLNRIHMKGQKECLDVPAQ